MKRAAFWGDVHVPFDDPGAEAVLVRWLVWFRPDLVCLVGDLIDFYPISKFDTDPKRRFSLAQDIKLANQYLDRIDAALPAGCRKVLLGGNHEDRLRKYLWTKAPELADLGQLSIPELFRLPERGWEYIPYYNPVGETGAPGLHYYNLLAVHGDVVRKYSAYTARAMFERFNYSGISGHTHRLGVYYHRAFGGQYVWYESGCMCTLEPPYKSSPDWQQGFLGVYVHDVDGDTSPRFEVVPGFIRKGRLSWCGHLFEVITPPSVRNTHSADNATKN